MGDSYDMETGKLCCEGCPTADGSVRRIACPFGYCKKVPLCAACRKKLPSASARRASHDQCRVASDRMKERDDALARLYADGRSVRCSAMAYFGDFVHVLFRKGDGTCHGRAMRKATYNALPILTPATPEDYAKHGKLYLAPDDFFAADGAGRNVSFESTPYVAHEVS